MDMAAMQGNAGGDAMAQAGSSQTSGQNSSSGSTTSDADTALVVEEVYAATGQVVAEGDPILKITDDSIADYQAQLEAAAETAQLNVKQEEINAESKKSEADYTYQMYLAEGRLQRRLIRQRLPAWKMPYQIWKRIWQMRRMMWILISIM